MLATAGGVASAAIGFVLGRTVHLAVPLPMSGSLVAALPRAVILLVVLARIDRFGALTLAGVAEVAAKLGLGLGGAFPLSVVAPIAAGIAADAAWWALKRLPTRRARLAICGGVLASTRVLSVVVLLVLVRVPIPAAPRRGGWIVWALVGANVLLGVIAGFLASAIAAELRKAGAME
jgi:hypothetical protein